MDAIPLSDSKFIMWESKKASDGDDLDYRLNMCTQVIHSYGEKTNLCKDKMEAYLMAGDEGSFNQCLEEYEFVTRELLKCIDFYCNLLNIKLTSFKEKLPQDKPTED